MIVWDFLPFACSKMTDKQGHLAISNGVWARGNSDDLDLLFCDTHILCKFYVVSFLSLLKRVIASRDLPTLDNLGIVFAFQHFYCCIQDIGLDNHTTCCEAGSIRPVVSSQGY